MARQVRDLMTQDVITVDGQESLTHASRAMKEHDIGDVIVLEDDRVKGILTDRDIVVRGIAEGLNPDRTPAGSIATSRLRFLAPDDDVAQAVEWMREGAVRRIPVVDEGRPVGIVSIGDLAIEQDPRSALASISQSEPNN